MAIFAAETLPRMKRAAWRFALLLCLLAAGSAHALGLGGELRLYSALNQPLRAELGLHLAAGEAPGDVQVRLADRDAYRRMGVAYHDGLPPLASAPAPAPVAATTAPAVAEKRPASPAAATYGSVQRGETLSQIAQRLKPEGVGTPQMTVALFEANPHAFIGGNMNRLRWGTTLYMPTLEAIAARSRGAAGKIMLEQQQALSPVAASTRETAAAPALQILAPAIPGAATGDLERQLQQVRKLNEGVEVENEELRQRLVQLEQQARQLAEQVLALPESPPAAASVPPAPASAATPAVAVEPRAAVVDISTAVAPPVGWHNPSWWIVLLGVLLVVCVAILGWLLWRRSRRWQYRDLAMALREDAEAKERARQELLEKARLRLR